MGLSKAKETRRREERKAFGGPPTGPATPPPKDCAGPKTKPKNVSNSDFGDDLELYIALLLAFMPLHRIEKADPQSGLKQASFFQWLAC